jgi:type IV secretion system protein VirD4
MSPLLDKGLNAADRLLCAIGDSVDAVAGRIGKPSQDMVFLAGVAIGAAALLLFVGGILALIPLKLFSIDLDPMLVPQFYWLNLYNTHVLFWWLTCSLGAALAGAGIALAMVYRKPKLHGEARWARERELVKERLRDKEGILLGRTGRKLIRFGGTEHVLLEAPTRAGKGVGVVIPNLLTWQGSAVVLDVKQENWELTSGWRSQLTSSAADGGVLKHKVLLFDPLDEGGRTARYNPLSYIRRDDPVEVINELQKIAAMLFPQPVHGESFWAESARTAFIGVASYIAATPELPFTFGEVYRQTAAGDPKNRFPKEMESRKHGEHPLPPQCVAALEDWTSSSDNTFTGIRQSVTAKINLWMNPYVDAATSASDFDLRTFRDVPTSLYLGVSPDNIERVADLYNLLFQQLVDLNVRELPSKGKHQVKLLLLLDEFARLGRASVIATGFSYVAGYNIRLLPVIQSRSQLRAIYGKDVSDEIIANCGVEVAFTPKELEMAKELSDRLGSYTFKAVSRSRKAMEGMMSGSRSESDQRRPLLLPQELMQFPKTQLILLRGGIPTVKGVKLTYYNDKRFAPLSRIRPPKVPRRSLADAVAAAEASNQRIAEAAWSAAAKEVTEADVAAGTPLPEQRLNPQLARAVKSEAAVSATVAIWAPPITLA